MIIVGSHEVWGYGGVHLGMYPPVALTGYDMEKKIDGRLGIENKQMCCVSDKIVTISLIMNSRIMRMGRWLTFSEFLLEVGVLPPLRVEIKAIPYENSSTYSSRYSKGSLRNHRHFAGGNIKILTQNTDTHSTSGSSHRHWDLEHEDNSLPTWACETTPPKSINWVRLIWKNVMILNFQRRVMIIQ